MLAVPDALHQRLTEHGQTHVLEGWGALTPGQQRDLLEQLQALDLELLRQLFGQRDQGFVLPAAERIAPVPVTEPDQAEDAARQAGEHSLRNGEVAVLLVAGGQGSRLGFEHPKGMFPIGPVSNKSLFQTHAEKALALGRRYGKPLPFLVMTSPATHGETESFFDENHYFGLRRDDIVFFRQGTMPALDIETGQLLLEKPGRLFTSPNGHGGTLTALADSGLLDRLRAQAIRHIFYFQVDNPLVKVADPAFVGRHLLARAEVSSKVVRKRSPSDKLGNLVLVDGRCQMIEYSDLPEDLARRLDSRGGLLLWAGSPAIHIFDVDFMERVTRGHNRIGYHFARKKVPHYTSDGRFIEPERENAIKFELFIFDVLPLAERWCVVETSRPEEFVPLKNASGPDSPAVVRQAISNLAGAWLEQAGITVPRDQAGNTAFPLEICPMYALDAAELAARVDQRIRIQGPLYLDVGP
jgi:UDP-N-acetylglucosamine/UDP-N-acetylgalactosamine diphosphorylase